jgi:TrmH family RNA methyltransferase
MKETFRLVQNLLEKRSVRHKEHRFVVEGPRLVAEASALIDFIVYSEELPIVERMINNGIDCHKVSHKMFADLSGVETPQGVLAVVRKPAFHLNDIIKEKNPLIIFCVEIQDPGNLGTIIRTADAVAASGVILSRGTVDLYNQKVIRSTMGSLFHLPVVQIEETKEVINDLKKNGIKIVAADISGKIDYFSADYKLPTAILIGNEGAGLPEEIIGLCDEVVKIPMPGRAESLNAGISAAVLLYEALRQRTSPLSPDFHRDSFPSPS